MTRRTAGLALVGAATAQAVDWPQWRGPERSGSIAQEGAGTWPERLKPAWKVAVGEGHSSPVLVSDRVFQFARRGDREVVAAFDLSSGKRLWETGYAAPYEMSSAATTHGKGPKSTPLAAGGKVYALGMTGVLTCVDAASGKVVWRYDSAGKFKTTSPLYGVAASPLLSGTNVIAHVGTDNDGALTAFDAGSGAVKWTWKGDGPAYSSPVIADIGGARQIVTFSASNLVSVSPGTGELLWKLPFTTPYAQNSVTPLVLGDVLIYSGLANPLTAVRLSKAGPPVKLWENKEAGMYMSSPVIAAGLLYGVTNRNKGQFVAIDPKTGKTVWTGEGRQAENALLVARGAEVLALTTESVLHVFKATPRGLQPVRQYTVADSPTWAHPVILGNRVLVKDRDSLSLLIPA